MDKFRDFAQSLIVDNNWVTVDLPVAKSRIDCYWLGQFPAKI